MKFFSENIVFFDTEFSSLNPYRGEILSMGLVTFSGEELYLELEFHGEIDPWVQQHVVPLFQGPKVDRETAVEAVRAFVGNAKPYMVSYVNPFDVVYWHKLVEVEQNPFYKKPIDFASILFGLGRDPQSYDPRSSDSLFVELGIDCSRYREHHALDDARLLRETYLKLLAHLA